MRGTFKLTLLAVAVLSLGACESMGLGNFESAAPYELERTAEHEQSVKVEPPPPAPAPAPQPAPQCKPCTDCSAWEQRALTAERDLAACQEATTRVRDAYRDELKK